MAHSRDFDQVGTSVLLSELNSSTPGMYNVFEISMDRGAMYMIYMYYRKYLLGKYSCC